MQTKTPLLTVDSIRDAHAAAKTVWTDDTRKSMELSNGTTALGIAVALGECRMPTDEEIMKNFDLYSRSPPAPRASSSTGRRSWSSATCAASAAATAPATP